MTTLFDEPVVEASPDGPPATRLRTTMAAMRLSFTWFGTRKTLSPEQKARAAESFGAEGDSLSAGKKLLNVRHPKFKAVTQIKGRAAQFWRSKSLPFPHPRTLTVNNSRLRKKKMNELLMIPLPVHHPPLYSLQSLSAQC